MILPRGRLLSIPANRSTASSAETVFARSKMLSCLVPFMCMPRFRLFSGKAQHKNIGQNSRNSVRFASSRAQLCHACHVFHACHTIHAHHAERCPINTVSFVFFSVKDEPHGKVGRFAWDGQGFARAVRFALAAQTPDAVRQGHGHVLRAFVEDRTDENALA